jgi:subtilase family serine protease
LFSKKDANSMRFFFFIALTILLSIQFAYGAVLSPLPPANGETPSSLSCIYGLTPYVPGCPIKSTSVVPQTGSGIIAVIDGGDDPDAYVELTQFSQQFNLHVLPQCTLPPSPPNPPCFQQYYASTCKAVGSAGAGSPPPAVKIIEPEIDMEWAHAMAPYASIYMIETDGWDIAPMISAVQCANTLLAQSGGTISFSDSFPETQEGPNEISYDSNFQIPRIIYFMSSGDYQAPARYPSTSPYVISAGGTSIIRDALGNYIEQVAWHNSGIPCDIDEPCKTGVSGGPSIYEPRPAYQNSVQKIVGSHRGTPDISFVAQGVNVFCCSFAADVTNDQCCVRPGTPPNPNKPSLPVCDTVANSSAPVCASGYGVWHLTGGTSLAAPALAGIINSAHSGATSSAEELSIIYNGAQKNYHSYWTDITKGNNGYPALQGYDFTTGLGVPRGYGGK